MTPPPLKEHLEQLAAYPAPVVEITLAVRELVLTEAPGAFESLQDAHKAVGVTYTFTVRQTDSFIHIVTHPSWVNLCFNQGATLPDPARLLRGDAKAIRYLRLSSVTDVEKAFVRKLVQEAVKAAKRPDIAGLAKNVIRATSTKRK